MMIDPDLLKEPVPGAPIRMAVDGGGERETIQNPKCGVELIAPQFLLGIGDVLTFGAKKYAPNNWMRGMSWTKSFGCVLRHLYAFFRGELNDKESGLPHLSHAACGLMFLWYYAHGKPKAYEQFDDRVFTP